MDLLTQGRPEDEGFVHEACGDATHDWQIERLKVENQCLKEKISHEKAKNAILHGELSKYKELARRVLHGDSHRRTWNSRQEAFVRLVSGLLGLQSERELNHENYQGHDIPHPPLSVLYLGEQSENYDGVYV